MRTRSEALSRSVRIEGIGEVAARFLAARRSARVAAVFKGCLYLEADGDFMCLGSGIGNGPLNAVVDIAAGRSWTSLVTPGQLVDIVDATIQAPAIAAVARAARRWQPQPWPQAASAETLQRALTRAEAIAARAAPTDGLFRLALHRALPKEDGEALARIACPRIARLDTWLNSCLGAAEQMPAPPVDLLGLGPGLTPSGDDLLCGVLIAFDALGARQAAAQLAAAIRAAAPRATTPLSAAFLAAAADGMGSEALHTFIAALIAGQAAALPAAMADLGGIGHTSGWDAMAGAVAVLRAAAEALPTRQSP